MYMQYLVCKKDSRSILLQTNQKSILPIKIGFIVCLFAWVVGKVRYIRTFFSQKKAIRF